jgi:3'-5' exoribonuclease
VAASRPRPVVVPLHQLRPGEPAEFFALLADRHRGTTRDGKPFFTCRFRDSKRTVSYQVWSDGPFFTACETEWRVGTIYRLYGVYGEHDRFGAQIDVHQIRPVGTGDEADGFAEGEFVERSRFDSEAMFAELCRLAETEVRDVPLRTLVLGLFETHREAILRLPAHPRAFFPFPGGWLEHTLSVTRSALAMADKYIAHYPELAPPLNRDLVAAAALLHEIGRAAELAVGGPGQPPEPTVPGHLFGHVYLGRDLVREAARGVEGLNPELVMLLEHVILSHLELPKWGSQRLPAIPEALILHHVDDLDAKMEMFVRCLRKDRADGPLTDRDPVLGKQLLKGRTV